MKQYEAWCLEYSEKHNFPGTWEMYCVVKDAWLAGYRTGVDDINKVGYTDVEKEVGTQIGQKRNL